MILFQDIPGLRHKGISLAGMTHHVCNGIYQQSPLIWRFKVTCMLAQIQYVQVEKLDDKPMSYFKPLQFIGK